MNTKPIGVFDSGIGGLTVVQEIIKALPQENIIYLGDTARVPYGARGKEVITAFALELTRFLLKQNVKYLVVACNTISATCLKEIQQISQVPVLDVISPSVEKIVTTTQKNKVGIIGTRATILSKAYEKEIQNLNPRIKIFTQACPLFVPIVEEGLYKSQIAYDAAKEYLRGFKQTGIDVLHLGCTHYPLLKETIQRVIGKKTIIIDSAEPTAQKLRENLSAMNLLNQEKHPRCTFYVTDVLERTYGIAKLFLGKDIKNNLKKTELNN